MQLQIICWFTLFQLFYDLVFKNIRFDRFANIKSKCTSVCKIYLHEKLHEDSLFQIYKLQWLYIGKAQALGLLFIDITNKEDVHLSATIRLIVIVLAKVFTIVCSPYECEECVLNELLIELFMLINLLISSIRICHYKFGRSRKSNIGHSLRACQIQFISL